MKTPLTLFSVVLSIVLLVPCASQAQWKQPALFQSAAPALGTRPADGHLARVDKRSDRVVPWTLAGALVGGVLGATAYLIQEHTIEHINHENDSLAFIVLTGSGAWLGALFGLVAATRA